MNAACRHLSSAAARREWNFRYDTSCDGPDLYDGRRTSDQQDPAQARDAGAAEPRRRAGRLEPGQAGRARPPHPASRRGTGSQAHLQIRRAAAPDAVRGPADARCRRRRHPLATQRLERHLGRGDRAPAYHRAMANAADRGRAGAGGAARPVSARRRAASARADPKRQARSRGQETTQKLPRTVPGTPRNHSNTRSLTQRSQRKNKKDRKESYMEVLRICNFPYSLSRHHGISYFPFSIAFHCVLCVFASRFRGNMSENEQVIIGLVSISDRASKGVYKDEGLPALEEWLGRVVLNPRRIVTQLIPDERPVIEATLKELCDKEGCDLVLTTGGTGPARRDVTPDATLAVADKVMPGFGEQMRQISLSFVPTAILSRQVGVIRGSTLIINLPGQPKSIKETLEGLKDADGRQRVHGIFAAVPYCIDLIGGPYIETDEAVVKAFRPKSALRPKI